ncbi:hypothetical protein FZW96_15180 [Bacillus sp. BGMRC 2118]|nr:hypothetical protein FZW96_15180 [Bacillus sp. BGMRC 2118]
MRDRWKWMISILLFVLLFNGAGIFLIQGFGDETDIETRSLLSVDNIKITIENEGKYPNELVEAVRNEIEDGTKSVLEVSRGLSIPNKDIKISLIPSSKETRFLPAYYSSDLVDPESIWLEEWNFEEMMLYNLFPQTEDMVPFTTIGLGQYLFYFPHKGEIFDPNEMWIAHKSEQGTLALSELLSPQLFKSTVLHEQGTYPANPNAEAHYWKIASFSYYLIEEYGMEAFVDLYESRNIAVDVEHIYGKSFIALETEWENRIAQMEEHSTPKMVQDLKYHYQYLYE